jgi:hypothetical protein
MKNLNDLKPDPDDAASLVLEANGCSFPRTARQPTNSDDTKTRAWNNNFRTSRNCGGEQTETFIVPIPQLVKESK